MRIMQCSQLKSAFYRFVIFCSASTRRLASGRRRTWLAICRVLATVTRPASWAQRCTFSVGLRRWSTSSHVMCIASISTRCSGASFIRESLSQHPFPDSLITMIYEQLWIPPSYRDFHTATVINNRMYIFGGRGDVHSPYHSQDEIYCPKIVYLDLKTHQWIMPTTTNNQPIGRRSHSACESNDFHVFTFVIRSRVASPPDARCNLVLKNHN